MTRKLRGELIAYMAMEGWLLIALVGKQDYGTVFFLAMYKSSPSIPLKVFHSFLNITPWVVWHDCTWGWKLPQEMDLGGEHSCRGKPELIVSCPVVQLKENRDAEKVLRGDWTQKKLLKIALLPRKKYTSHKVMSELRQYLVTEDRLRLERSVIF